MKCCVYRIYDPDGGLVYIGHSKNLRQRLINHGSQRIWQRLICRVEAEWFETRAEARRAEAAAIASEDPKYNQNLKVKNKLKLCSVGWRGVDLDDPSTWIRPDHTHEATQ